MPAAFRTVSVARFRAVVCALALASLAGCASRPDDRALETVSPIPGAKLVTVFVATTRKADPASPTSFNAARSQTLAYARYVVSVPPAHKPAEVEMAKGRPDPAKHFAIVEAQPLSEVDFLRETAADAMRAKNPGTVGVFVHGYNYTFEESLFRRAQLANDANVVGAPVLFAWPSAASPTAYVADRDASTMSRDGLAHVLERLTADRRLKVLLFSHSLGSGLTMEALRDLRLSGRDAALDRLQDVVLASPDIDIDLFLEQLRDVGRLDPPLVVLVSKDDGALSLSRLLSGDRRRVGSADIADPRVQTGAKRYDVRVIDISGLDASKGMGHDRYAQMAALYPKLRAQLDARAGVVSKAGAYLFNATTATFSAAPAAAQSAAR